MLDAIRTFIDVVSTGSFSGVAKHQDVAVSSITRKIDALEEELGVKLLVRRSRSITLSDAGEQFLPRARSIVAEFDDTRQALVNSQADPRGLLTISAPTAFGRRHIVPAVSSFLAKYPQIEIELDASDHQVDLLTQRLDLAIRIGVLPDSDLIATRLAPMQRVVCASPDYLARHGHPANPAELVDHNCLNYASTALPAGWWRFSGVNHNAALPVHGTLRSDDTETLLEAAAAGIGIVHLATWLVYDMLKAGKLIQLFPADAPSLSHKESALYAVRLPGRSHAKKAQMFIAHLKDHIGDTPYWDRA
jgi:DNA-binding transcriptional LysR family regulator